MDAAADGSAFSVASIDPSGAVSAPNPLDDESFAAVMTRFGPFERHPRLAVAVSGGADSMTLALLAKAWTMSHDGTLLALTVDHGLRPNSRDEAETVGRWLRTHDIAHEILTWNDSKPATGRQEAARAARYRLLLDRCHAGGILHLMLGHHQDDQAETVLLRVAAGSGMDGLAAMSEVRTTPYARLLRPLLDVPRVRLEAALVSRGQAWIDDPSNQNSDFQRVRLRKFVPTLEDVGLGAKQWAALADRAGAVRAAFDEAAAAVTARSATLSPAGFARIDRDLLLDAPPLIGMRALDHVLRTVGGAAYSPRVDRLEHLWTDIRTGLKTRRSLGGCLVAPTRQGLLIQREPAAIAGPVKVRCGQSVLWDGRYMVCLAGRGRAMVGALGSAGWRDIKAETAPHDLPAAVLPTLPALLDSAGKPQIVPHLEWRRRGGQGPGVVQLAFAPLSPLTGGLVWHGTGIMC